MAENVFIIDGYEFPMSRPWRVGRSVGRTIYIQSGDDPAKGDRLIGLMDSMELATHVVVSVNAHDELADKVYDLTGENGRLLQEIDTLRRDAVDFQAEFDRMSKALKDAAEAASSEFVNRLTGKGQEPATGTVSVPWDVPDDQDAMTKEYVDSQVTANARERDLAMQLKAMQEQRNAAEATCDRLRKLLKDENEQFSRLQTKYDDLTAANVELVKERNRSQQKIMDLGLQCVGLKDKRYKAQEEAEAAKRQIADQAAINVGAIDKMMTSLKDMTQERNEALQKVEKVKGQVADQEYIEELADLNERLKRERDEFKRQRDHVLREAALKKMLEDQTDPDVDAMRAMREVDEAEVRGRKAADWAWKRRLETERAADRARIAELEKERDEAVEEAEAARRQRDYQANQGVNAVAKLKEERDKLHHDLYKLHKDLANTTAAVSNDIEELRAERDRLRGDAKVLREAYAHLLASQNELGDLVIREFGSSVAEEGATQAAIRLLKEQRKQIADLEKRLAGRSPDQTGAADSAVNVAADIASTLAAGIREWNEKKRLWKG